MPALDLFESGYGHDYASYGSSEHLDIGWQSLRLTQERLSNLNRGFPPTTSASADDLGSYLVPSSSSSSLSSLSSSRSPIILDPPQLARGNLHRPVISQHSQSPHPPGSQRRMSALEIAQNYRQQQALQERKQHMLPTPPDSTSPLWSSAFSPYQESLLSPDVLTGSHLPSLLSAKASMVHQSELQQYTRMAEYEQMTKAARGEHIDLPYIHHGSPYDNMALYQDILLANNMDRLSVQVPPPHGPLYRNPSSTPQRSPVPPRPPPNTPASAARRDKNSAAHHTGAPMSPTTQTLKQNAPQQHPRSIPMSRLIQRRLSAVPEEDSCLLSDHGPSPPPDAGRVPGRDKDMTRNARVSRGQSGSVRSQVRVYRFSCSLEAERRSWKRASHACSSQGQARRGSGTRRRLRREERQDGLLGTSLARQTKEEQSASQERRQRSGKG